MRFSLRLNPRERATIMNIRLDSILSQRISYQMPQFNELLEALIFYSDYELGHNRKLAVEIAKYFSYKKNLPLRILPQEEGNAEDRIPLVEEDIQDSELEEIIGLEEMIGALRFSLKRFPLDPVEMTSTPSGYTSQFADDKVNSIITKIFNAQDPNEIKISNSVLIKGLVHFLATDMVFQIVFRTYMYIGSLYGLKYNEMGAILDGVTAVIDEKKFVRFRDAFIKDYNLFSTYLNNESKRTGMGFEKNSTGEFSIPHAVDRYFILFFMTRMMRYNCPYFTCFEAAIHYKNSQPIKYENIKKMAKPVLSLLLSEMETILKDTIQG